MVETKFQTSFIPKKPLVQEGSGTRTSVSLFLLISILVFLASVGIGGWVFLENQLLIKQVTDQQQIIEKNKSSFDATTIDSIVELNSRIGIAATLLSTHVAVSPIYDFFQRTTLKNVRFKDFTFTANGKDSSGNTIISVQMAGQARDFETVASQADEFGKPDWKNIINQPKIANLNLNQDGSVSFTFSASLVPAFLSYTNTQTNSSITQ